MKGRGEDGENAALHVTDCSGAGYAPYVQSWQIPDGAPCFPPPVRSASSRTENQEPQPWQVPKHGTGPGTIQTHRASAG